MAQRGNQVAVVHPALDNRGAMRSDQATEFQQCAGQAHETGQTEVGDADAAGFQEPRILGAVAQVDNVLRQAPALQRAGDLNQHRLGAAGAQSADDVKDQP